MTSSLRASRLCVTCVLQRLHAGVSARGVSALRPLSHLASRNNGHRKLFHDNGFPIKTLSFLLRHDAFLSTCAVQKCKADEAQLQAEHTKNKKVTSSSDEISSHKTTGNVFGDVPSGSSVAGDDLPSTAAGLQTGAPTRITFEEEAQLAQSSIAKTHTVVTQQQNPDPKIQANDLESAAINVDLDDPTHPQKVEKPNDLESDLQPPKVSFVKSEPSAANADGALTEAEVKDLREYMTTEEGETLKERLYSNAGVVDYSYFRDVIRASKEAGERVQLSGSVDLKPEDLKPKVQDREPRARAQTEEEESRAPMRTGRRRGRGAMLWAGHEDPPPGLREAGNGDPPPWAAEAATPGRADPPSIDQVPLGDEAGEGLPPVKHQPQDTAPDKPRKSKVFGLKNLKPKPPVKSYTLAPYVNENEVLQKLVSLGVDLNQFEVRDRKAAAHVMRCDWETDIQPYIVFLHQLGVPDEALGTVFTKCPSILLKEIEQLQGHIDYLRQKRFPEHELPIIISRSPRILNYTLEALDINLGYLQRTFKLTGDEVRLAVIKTPKIAVWDQRELQLVKDHFELVLCFTKEETKRLFLGLPRLFMENTRSISESHAVVTEEMKIPRERIIAFPGVLKTRDYILKERHRFLVHLGRDQYDPTKPNFVSLKALAVGKDYEFTRKVAKVPVQVFRDFVKTM